MELPRAVDELLAELLAGILQALGDNLVGVYLRGSLATLPEPWRGLVAAGETWRNDDTVDLSVNADVRQFVLWVATMGQS